MEECESLDSEMTELQEFQYEASEAISQDDEDEVEELQNSLREVVQDQSVKPKLQCLMVDPSFSMVTVQSEDSGIVWETASSRCSTPWASETSSTSEAYSMEGSGAAGKITIVFDEEKIVRRRIRSGGRSSRLGDRLSRPGSSRSASALGVERPEMAEVSLPNVKQEKIETEPDLEEIKNKDQQLFSLISEGYEILNIRVPSKLPTVDEEESTDLQDNLSYLDETPKIRSRQQYPAMPEEGEILDHQEPSEQDSSQSVDTELRHTPTQKESTSDIDYFEKFTLLDEVVPGEQAPTLQEEAEQPTAKPPVEEQKPAEETATDSPSASDDSFVFVTDVEIAGEHLDEVFYGEAAPADALQRRDDDEVEGRAGMRMRRESQRSGKESGSVLFGSEETILTPIFISSGPPKIIDLILLEEPTAMSFMYSDLYEDAVGERRKSDEEYSEAESVASEKSYKRRLSDSEEGHGYLEKFILKDETPTVEVKPEPAEDEMEGRRMWSQSKFEMTGCLTRVVKEDKDEDKIKTEEPKTQEVSVGERSEDLKSTTFEEKREIVTEPEREKEEKHVSLMTEEQAAREASEQSIQESKLRDDQMDDHKVEHEKKRDQTEGPESGTDKPLPEMQQVDSKVEKTEDCEELQREVPAERTGVIETEQPCETQEAVEKTAQVVANATEKTAVIAHASGEVPQIIPQSEILTEIPEKSLSEEALSDTKTMAADEKIVAEAPAEVKEPETERQEMLTSTARDTSAETLLCEDKEAAAVVSEDIAPVEVITDCSSTVHAVVEVTEKAVDEKEIQTQVQIDLQEVTSVATTDVQTAAPEGEEGREALTEDTAVQSQRITEADQESEVKTEISREVAEPVTDSDTKQHDILETKQHQQEESVTDCDSDKRKLITEAEAKTSTEDTETVVQEKVNVDDDLILLIPKGQAVEMDIGISQWSEKTTSDTVALSEPDSTCERLIAPETITISSEELQVPTKETMTDPQLEIKPEVGIKEEALPSNELPPLPVEEAKSEEQKVEQDFEEDEASFSPLRSLPPLEDLCWDRDDITSEAADAEKKAEMHKVEVTPETDTIKEDSSPQIELHRDVVGQKVDEKDEAVAEAPEVTAEELEYEVISKQDAKEMPEPETQRGEEKPVDEKEIQTQVQIDLQEVTSVATTDVQTAAPEGEEGREALTEDTAVQSQRITEADQESEVKMEISREVAEPVMPEEVKTDTEVLEYEVISKQDAKQMPEHETQRGEEEPVDEKEIQTQVQIDLQEVTSVVTTDVQTAAPEGEEGREALTEDTAVQSQRITETDQESEVKTEISREVAGPVMPEEVKTDTEVLEYEVISKQDAKQMPEHETQRGEEEPKPESGQQREERVVTEKENRVFDLSPEEEVIEADYEIFDEEEESQARLAAELEGMDWFCLTCGCLLSKDNYVFGEHHSHEVTGVDKAYEEIKEKLSDWISELQGRSENTEDLVSELELAYNSVEDQCVEIEAAMQAQNEEMMALVMEQYNNMSVSMEEEKKAKLEQLYDQIVSFQESIDSAKATLETTAREAETDARSPEDILERLKVALDSAMSLELGPKGLLVFEDYAKGNTSSSHLAQRKGIPVPQRPTLQPQEPGSATSTSVTVYWKVNPGDIIDCFQVYCMEDPQGAVSEEYRVTVKESYCVLEELEPDKTYKVWVMAVNYTGCSLPSERLSFRTAPSVPVIDTERCTVMWDSATLRWSSKKQTLEQSYTLEYSHQYELEGEGLRSISGIKDCEQRVLLQPNVNYLFYIKAVNEAGASEQSEAALISTKGTRFHLLKASAHPALELSVDQTTLHYSQEEHENTPSTEKPCPCILGELLPAQGHYYWETIVSGSTAYRLGVAYSSAYRNSPLGENSQSWCLQCVPTPSGCRYQLLHNDVQSSVFVIEIPERVGTLLDYQLGRLSFYNAQSGQLLGTFCQRFTQPCQPALALEMPGSLEVCMVPEKPAFIKDS